MLELKDFIYNNIDLFILFSCATVIYAMFPAMFGNVPKRMALIEKKLDALLEHSGIDFPPQEELAKRIFEELRNGKKIFAIKSLRDTTKLGLKECKAIIDEIESRNLNEVGDIKAFIEDKGLDA